MFGFFNKIGVDNINPKIPFGSTKECSKCGGKKFKRTFVPHSSMLEYGIHYHEHMNVECQKCGATFWEKPKDAY